MDLSGIALSYLLEVSVRSLLMLLVAAVGMWIFRVHSPSAKHAVWTLAIVGMLVLAVLTPVLPPLPLRILSALPAAPPAPITEIATLPTVKPAAPVFVKPAGSQWKLSWTQLTFGFYLLGAVVFLTRFLFGYLFTTRLVRSGSPVGRATLPAADFEAAGPDTQFCESTWISAPMTVGWIHPKILLPIGWREWEESKLRAVLTHELAHVRRADWLIAALATLNKSLFWFHPLAWWLERRLASLAEQACDDTALLALGNREQYASALLDMARAVNSARGRLAWRAIAMAEPSQIGSRIDRILDDSKPIPRGLTRARRLALALCSLPLFYLVSALQLVPTEVLGQEARVPVQFAELPNSQWLIEGNQLTASQTAELERAVVANPENVDARGKLIAYYYRTGVREPRLAHIWWMIEHHPESPVAGFASAGISPRYTRLNTAADYEWTRTLWLRQTAQFPDNAKVLASAVRFFGASNKEFDEAERLLKQLRRLEPGQQSWSDQLASLYTSVIVGTIENPSDGVNRERAERAKASLEASTDGMLLARTNSLMTLEARRIAGLEKPEMKAAAEALSALATRLFERAEQFGVRRYPPTALEVKVNPAQPPAPDVLRQAQRQAQLEAALEQLRQAKAQMEQQAAERMRQLDAELRQREAQATSPVEGAPQRRRVGADPVEHIRQPQRIRVGSLVQAHMLVDKPEPVYPEVAKQEGIEGSVRFNVTIATDGHVRDLQLISGHPALVAAAQEAVNRWTYRNTLLNGKPVEVVTQVDVPFTLPVN